MVHNFIEHIVLYTFRVHAAMHVLSNEISRILPHGAIFQNGFVVPRVKKRICTSHAHWIPLPIFQTLRHASPA
jgi:hypothetical protein